LPRWSKSTGNFCSSSSPGALAYLALAGEMIRREEGLDEVVNAGADVVAQ